ncbi:hypothetical protein H0H81_000061, partial [Sphagnurus paluster]
AVFFIPFEDNDNEQNVEIPLPKSLHNDRDLLNGEKLRLDAYMAAWKKCISRVKVRTTCAFMCINFDDRQSIIETLHAPIVAEVVQQVHTAYDNVLTGLPYPELPVITITNPTCDTGILDQITAHTNSSNLDISEDLFNATALTVHLYPSDCVNLTTVMKALIGGFVERDHILERVKGRSAVSLANYDIEVLAAWYAALRETLYVARLPLVFLLALSSPASPSYLHTTYPRSTLALLRVRNYDIPSGPQVLQEVLVKTFFDLEFEPDIMIGPTVLTFLAEYHSRHNASLDGAITILQLAHLKHFSAEPLTVLVNSTPEQETLDLPASILFLGSLLSRLPDSTTTTPTDHIIASIDAARTAFRTRARHVRIALGLVRLAQGFMAQNGYKGLGWSPEAQAPLLGDGVLVDVLAGGLGADVKFLGALVKKLPRAQLGEMLQAIHAYFNDMPGEMRADEEEARMRVVFSINALPHKVDVKEEREMAVGVGEWFVEYLNGLLSPLEDIPLWDIWYTGLVPFPAELLNPSLRASIVAGLLQPYDFTDNHNGEASELWKLPDTCILFRRYLDSGRMVNVYDWFEAFRLEVETQRAELRKKNRKQKMGSLSPAKRGRKPKGKQVEKEVVEEEEDGDGGEQWKLEVQARFMRALQELDYLGFIKHTGRKADHVQRVVYDMHE